MNSEIEIAKQNSETTTVTCSNCSKEQNISQFISLINGSQTLQCLSCRRPGMDQQKLTPKQIVYQLCKDLMKCCEICGDSDKDHLEFDHIDRLTKIAVVGSLSASKILAEASKCRVLCKKDHRKITIEEDHCRSTSIPRKSSTSKGSKSLAASRQRNRDYIRSIKLHIGRCMNPCCKDVFDKDNLTFYEFDHINPLSKIDAIAVLVLQGRSIEFINSELLKCQLLCGYYHKQKTRDDRKLKIAYFLTLKVPIPSAKPPKELSIDDADAKRIRKLFQEGSSIVDLARCYNVCRGHICRILHNESHRDPNYTDVGKIPKSRHTQLTLGEQAKILELWNKDSATYTIEALMLKFSCTDNQIRKVLRFNESDMNEMRRLYKENASIRELAERFHFTTQRVTEIVSGVIKNAVRDKADFEARKAVVIERSRIDSKAKTDRLLDRNTRIKEDFEKNKMTTKELVVKYELCKSSILTIIRK
jgi:Mor family transcriptional regulator